MTAVELGSDVGGSIRGPAHCCGVFGHKPTHGIVPQRGHIPGPPGSLSERDIAVIGPLARSAIDLELVLDVICGPDAVREKAWSLRIPPARHPTLRAFRIAAWLDDASCPVDEPIRNRLAELLDALRREGLQVDESARPAFTGIQSHRLYLRLLYGAASIGLSAEEYARILTLAEDPGLKAKSTRHAEAPGLRLCAAWQEFFLNSRAFAAAWCARSRSFS